MDGKTTIAVLVVATILLGSQTETRSTLERFRVPHPVTGTAGYDCGDINDDGDLLDISDLVYLIDYMFQSEPPPPLACQADLDGNDWIDISDLVALVDYMFLSGSPPADCCDDVNNGSFTLGAPYTYIRSYPGGGGVCMVSITPGDDFEGNVFLTLSAHPDLNAQLDRDFLNDTAAVAEITIIPSEQAAIEWYQIVLTATHAADTQSVTLDVEMFPWNSANIADAEAKRDPLLEWIENNYPELGSLSDQEWYGYFTYPQTWVVEHWTFLSDDWELRICYHVMIPPHDWSMLRLRPRGELNASIAARRESDGATYEIPLNEYPIKFGY